MKKHNNRYDLHRQTWEIFIVQLKPFVILFQLLHIVSQWVN